MQTLVKISERFFYLTPVQKTDRPVLAAVVGDDHTLLIDAGNSVNHTKLFREQLAKHAVKGDYLVLTHSDWDHVFGLSEIKVPVIAQQKTAEKLKHMQTLSWEDSFLDERVEAGIEIPFCADAIKLELGNERAIVLSLPQIIFNKTLQINLGGVTCMIEHVGGDHAEDSTIIYLPEEKILFLGDCLYANLYAEKWNYTVEKSLQLIQKLESFEAETVFLSHHQSPLTKDEFQKQLSFMKLSAQLTKKHEGNKENIEQELAQLLARVLTDEEIETVEFYVNGF
ncbi:MBL fold metallo-hydrolase [Bacillus cihuensis]|uniref:MBL fold metallo-hydrolase n=1 Tax=Bacillus cihuensis TaxID=1208599 RepID=UPI0004226C4A|nr:MBL fold metallo-hydrolase [Bacillus cihuensis]